MLYTGVIKKLPQQENLMKTQLSKMKANRSIRRLFFNSRANAQSKSRPFYNLTNAAQKRIDLLFKNILIQIHLPVKING